MNALYTCCTGDYDAMIPPQVPHHNYDNWDFICFTDGDEVAGWTNYEINGTNTSVRTARYCKIMMNEVLKDWL